MHERACGGISVKSSIANGSDNLVGVDRHRSGGFGGGIAFFVKAETPSASPFPEVVW
jgi:hypothetical protein